MSSSEALYHYCSTQTFHAIVESGKLRLSSLSLSNDTMEGKLVARTVSELAAKESLGAEKTQQLQQMLELFDDLFDGLGFCLSEERDLLSQWRGYAGDGSGVCIGFSKQYLEWLAEDRPDPEKPGFSLQKVKYERDEHESEVLPTFNEAKRRIEEGAFNYSVGLNLLDSRTDEEVEQERKQNERARTRLSFTLLMLLPKLYLLKSQAFREEREWRLLSHLVHGDKDCSYIAKDHRIVPFRSVELREKERKPIVEVILGPKHSTPSRVVENFLRCYGFDEVKVLHSDATYR